MEYAQPAINSVAFLSVRSCQAATMTVAQMAASMRKDSLKALSRSRLAVTGVSDWPSAADMPSAICRYTGSR